MTALNNLYPAATTLPSGAAAGLTPPAATTLPSGSAAGITPPPGSTLPSGADQPIGTYAPLAPAPPPDPAPYANWGEVALELAATRSKGVPDDAGRFALTPGDGIRVGTIVTVAASGITYMVVDLEQLDVADGYVPLGPPGPATVIVRNGTAAELAAFVLDVGELGYATDTKLLYVGDGVTAGGSLVTSEPAAPFNRYSLYLNTDFSFTGATSNIIPTDFRNGLNDILHLELGATVSDIGTRAFKGCLALVGTLRLPPTVGQVGSEAFAQCSNLTGSIELLGVLFAIGAGAFQDCAKLTGPVEIGSSLAFGTIGDDFISGCALLSVLNIRLPITKLGANSLRGSFITEIHALESDASWTAGVGLTIAGKTGLTVIKDLQS